uniref:Uncharacterized protein n=1 Tax=Trichogramma kaykai TaxID=54128 RepID=A0ABD2XGU1_9HYME
MPLVYRTHGSRRVSCKYYKISVRSLRGPKNYFKIFHFLNKTSKLELFYRGFEKIKAPKVKCIVSVRVESEIFFARSFARASDGSYLILHELACLNGIETSLQAAGISYEHEYIIYQVKYMNKCIRDLRPEINK